MLKCLVSYYELAIKTVESSEGINWSKVREATSDIWYRLTQMKFEDPAQGEGEREAALSRARVALCC
jgi:V-type H+-transporting ATPase subunit A